MEFQRALLAAWGKLIVPCRSIVARNTNSDHLQAIVSISPLYFLQDESIFPSSMTYHTFGVDQESPSEDFFTFLTGKATIEIS
jgi:hypothetical protein